MFYFWYRFVLENFDRILNLVRRRSGHIIVCLHAHTGNSGRKIGILLMRFDLCKKLRDTIYLIA